MSKSPLSESVVAIDLGSNSFHLLEAVGQAKGGMKPVTTMAKKVQLGLGMTDGRLHIDAIERGLACLEKFAPYTQGRCQQRVRIVGTQALRLATNRADFVGPASQLLGQPIEIVSGEQEAALAYQGVARYLGADDGQMALVVDIGGGSTEWAIGKGDTVGAVFSVAVGCVSSLRYFPDAVISEQNLACAQAAALAQFRLMSGEMNEPWHVAIGCSGTLLAVEQVLIQQGWSSGGITAQGLTQLRSALLQFASIEQVAFQGLKEDRRSIFASGTAIVLALFEAFNIRHMSLSPAGLREGIAWQLLQQVD